MSIYDSSLNMVQANVHDSKHGKVNRATANAMYKEYVKWFGDTYGRSEKPLSFKDWMNWAKSRNFLSATGSESSRTSPVVAPPIVRNPIPSSSGGGNSTPPPPVKNTTPSSSGGGSGGGGGGGPKPTDENLKDLNTVNKTGRNIAIVILALSAVGIIMALGSNKQQTIAQ